ncbi:MAG: hypothetical protein AB7S65_01090 [Sulfuricurvum sp.]
MTDLYRELLGMELQFHRVMAPKKNKIFLDGIDLDPRGIDEVMKIKALADRYRFDTVWDGTNIEIGRCLGE